MQALPDMGSHPISQGSWTLNGFFFLKHTHLAYGNGDFRFDDVGNAFEDRVFGGKTYSQ